MACPTLGDNSAKQTFGAGHRQQRGGTHPASRLAEDSDVIRIAAEGRDVLLHPCEGGDLVEQTEIRDTVTKIEESVRSKTVVDGDTYHSIAGEATTVILWYCA